MLLIIKNSTEERPAALELILKEKNIAYEIKDLDEKGEHFPDPKEYQAVIVLGGPDSANDKTDKMQEELKRVQEIIDLKIPYLGICLGMQVLTKAAGGKVRKNEVKEVGFRDPDGNIFTVSLTEAGKADPLFAGLPQKFPVFHLHGETVEIPAAVTLLGTGTSCHHQIVRIQEGQYGFQCHFELTPEMFQDWVEIVPALQEIPDLREDFAKLQKEYLHIGRTIFENFLRIAKLI